MEQPGRLSPPHRGMTFRQVEHQLAALQKENFNLKLRIYFMKEQVNSRYSGEDIVQTRITVLEEEVSSLQAELHDKNEQIKKVTFLEDEVAALKEELAGLEEKEAQYQADLAEKNTDVKGLAEKLNDKDREMADLAEKIKQQQLDFDEINKLRENAEDQISKLQLAVDRKNRDVTRLSMAAQNFSQISEISPLERDHMKDEIEDARRSLDKTRTQCSRLEDQMAHKDKMIAKLEDLVRSKDERVKKYDHAKQTIFKLEANRQSYIQKNEKLEAKNKDLEAEIAQLKAQLGDSEAARKRAEDTLKEREGYIEQLARTLGKKEFELSNFESLLKKAEKSLALSEAAVESLQKQLKQESEGRGNNEELDRLRAEVCDLEKRLEEREAAYQSKCAQLDNLAQLLRDILPHHNVTSNTYKVRIMQILDGVAPSSNTSQCGSHMTDRNGHMTDGNGHMSNGNDHMTDGNGHMTHDHGLMTDRTESFILGLDRKMSPRKNFFNDRNNHTNVSEDSADGNDHMTADGHMTSDGHLTPTNDHMTTENGHVTDGNGHMTDRRESFINGERQRMSPYKRNSVKDLNKWLSMDTVQQKNLELAARNEHLNQLLKATEETVHAQTHKMKYYRNLLVEHGLIPRSKSNSVPDISALGKLPDLTGLSGALNGTTGTSTGGEHISRRRSRSSADNIPAYFRSMSPCGRTTERSQRTSTVSSVDPLRSGGFGGFSALSLPVGSPDGFSLDKSDSPCFEAQSPEGRVSPDSGCSENDTSAQNTTLSLTSGQELDKTFSDSKIESPRNQSECDNNYPVQFGNQSPKIGNQSMQLIDFSVNDGNHSTHDYRKSLPTGDQSIHNTKKQSVPILDQSLRNGDQSIDLGRPLIANGNQSMFSMDQFTRNGNQSHDNKSMQNGNQSIYSSNQSTRQHTSPSQDHNHSVRSEKQPVKNNGNQSRTANSFNQSKTANQPSREINHTSKPADTSSRFGNQSMHIGDQSMRVRDQSSRFGDQSIGVPVSNQSIRAGDQSMRASDQSIGLGDQSVRIGDQSMGLGDQSMLLNNTLGVLSQSFVDINSSLMKDQENSRQMKEALSMVIDIVGKSDSGEDLYLSSDVQKRLMMLFDHVRSLVDKRQGMMGNIQTNLKTVMEHTNSALFEFDKNIQELLSQLMDKEDLESRVCSLELELGIANKDRDRLTSVCSDLKMAAEQYSARCEQLLSDNKKQVKVLEEEYHVKLSREELRCADIERKLGERVTSLEAELKLMRTNEHKTKNLVAHTQAQMRKLRQENEHTVKQLKTQESSLMSDMQSLKAENSRLVQENLELQQQRYDIELKCKTLQREAEDYKLQLNTLQKSLVHRKVDSEELSRQIENLIRAIETSKESEMYEQKVMTDRVTQHTKEVEARIKKTREMTERFLKKKPSRPETNSIGRSGLSAGSLLTDYRAADHFPSRETTPGCSSSGSLSDLSSLPSDKSGSPFLAGSGKSSLPCGSETGSQYFSIPGPIYKQGISDECMRYRVQDSPMLLAGLTQVRIDSDIRTLFAVGKIDDFEKLRKETSESQQILRGLTTRVDERLKILTALPASEMIKSVEYSTLKEVSYAVRNLSICAEGQQSVICCFWTSELPVPNEHGEFVNQRQLDTISELKLQLGKMRKQHNTEMNNQQTIIDSLSGTLDVVSQARHNLETRAGHSPR